MSMVNNITDSKMDSQKSDDSIAIIGMGCRFPGDINSSSKLWEFLREGRTAQCDVPPGRFNVDGFYHPNGLNRPGSITTKGGYFLREDPRLFDPDFFNIIPLEAAYMDPQQRKLLETVYEAFESAGATLDSVSSANIGCYVGNFTMDYQTIQTRDPEYLHRYVATGMGTTILSNRISHTFNLRGPSLVLDTACSSSIYCLHVACTSLKNRECEAAIVAGANLIQSPEQHMATMKAGILSPTSTCHTFSSNADGYGRADGIGCLYLKRLSDAIENNDPIRGVIVGTAINSNGRTPGITHPSSAGQELAIRKAYQNIGLDYGDTAYVECHGTGTPVGDPIEVETISKVFSGLNSRPLLLGSVKTNLGHSEAASGIAAIMKTVLAIENGEIPPTIGVNSINPSIKASEWNIKVVTSTTPWPKLSDAPHLRRASVNSFGYGGANAHAILESAEHHVHSLASNRDFPPKTSRNWYLLPVSANSAVSLDTRAQDLRDYFSSNRQHARDFVYTLSMRRTHFSQRSYTIIENSSFDGKFDMRDSPAPRKRQTAEPGEIAFIFTGQGAQWPRMGKALYDEFPTFADAIREMDAALRRLRRAPTWSLIEAIFEPEESSKIHDASRSQPACTAIQVALVILLESWGITPSTVVGHSSGEIAAAFAAGLLSVPDAIAIAYYRGYAVSTYAPVDGAMLAVGLSQADAQAEIELIHQNSRIRIACINSPENVTISGDNEVIDELHRALDTNNILARKLFTGGRAYHSHHMANIGDQYVTLLTENLKDFDEGCRTRASRARWISSVTGEQKVDVPDAGYWRSNLENPVLFSKAMQEILCKKQIHFVEIGPHSALEMPLKQIRSSLKISEDRAPYIPTLVRKKHDMVSILSTVGSLFLQGYRVLWDRVNDLGDTHPGGSKPRVLHDLPPYPWTYGKPMWHESRASYEFRTRKYLRHELLGSQLPGGNGTEIMWRNVLKLADVPWLSDHKLEKTTVLPGAAYISMATEAARQVTGLQANSPATFLLEKVKIITALVIPTDEEVEVFTTLRPASINTGTQSNDCYDFCIISHAATVSTTHATGSIKCARSLMTVSQACVITHDLLQPTHPRVWYRSLEKAGLNFGPAFQTIEKFYVPRTRTHQLCTTMVSIPRGLDDYDLELPQYIIHPITIDAMIQTALVANTCGNPRDMKAKVPVSFGSIIIQVPPEGLAASSSYFIDSESTKVGFGASKFQAELRSRSGDMVCQIKNVKLAPYNSGISASQTEDRHPMLRVQWKPDPHGLGLMPQKDFAEIVERLALEPQSQVADNGQAKIRAIFHLLVHKNPTLRVLEIKDGTHGNASAKDDLCSGLYPYPKGLTWETRIVGHPTEASSTRGTKLDRLGSQQYDLVFLPECEIVNSCCMQEISQLKPFLTQEGMILALGSPRSSYPWKEEGFDNIDLDVEQQKRIILAQPIRSNKVPHSLSGLQVYVVSRWDSLFTRQFASYLTGLTGREVKIFSLSDIQEGCIGPGSTIFSFLEAEKPFLSVMSDQEFMKLQTIVDNASQLVWITSTDLLSGCRPESGLAFGLSRAIMMEQPSTKFYIFDVDDIHLHTERTFANLVLVLRQRSGTVDYEFAQSKGIVHVSRFVPDDELNSKFRQKQGASLIETPLGRAKPAQLTISEVGNFDTLHFERFALPAELSSDEVQVSVKSVGLNAKDFYALAGKVDTKDASCTLEYCGVIERVGIQVVDLAPGDRVVVMAPGHFRTSEIVPFWACQKLLGNESFDVMCTLPIAFATALYALRDRAQLRVGETVLIHSATGGVGIAAIQIAQRLGAKIHATVSNDEKARYLVDNFHLNRENIYNSRDASFHAKLLSATNGRGVDVVLNSLSGELLYASWKCCAAFGRFVEIGKHDLVDFGRLEMDGFLRSTTFTAFDLSDLYYHNSDEFHRTWTCLLTDVLSLFRSGDVFAISPLCVFDVSQTANAIRHFASRNRMGKVVVSLEKTGSLISLRPNRHETAFSAEKTYVMVGCLGGIGRSLSRWMVSRGARKFVFLGRSGTEKPAAKALFEELEQSGARCISIRGDVCNKLDVERAVAAVEGKIGGVVQAAMGLSEALFTKMKSDEWHKVIRPKVQGTWNLHEAIKQKDDELEFFLMTSSISGSVGTATESNYCAGNCFLDLFARYRQSLGLPATSIGFGMISEVGYLHENPDIEHLLLRKGIQAIDEDEMLQIVDTVLSRNHDVPSVHGNLSHSHILTGLELSGLQALRAKGFEGPNLTLDDPRASILNHLLDNDRQGLLQPHDGGLPIDVMTALENGLHLSEATMQHIIKKFSNLVLLPPDRVDILKPLLTYGMDSMIAAEFRSWFFKVFQIDLPFLKLLSKDVTLASLNNRVVLEMEAKMST
ncbi:polyketide synthase [Annulohypoxylon bovei var. microspora]|nr:polyketide synthase [Annulohypoxylon bovei var. microspora]